MAETLEASFRVSNSVDAIVQLLTVSVKVNPAEFSNHSEVSVIAGSDEIFVAGGNALMKIVARDKYDNEIEVLTQPPMLDIFSVETAERWSQSIPSFTLSKAEEGDVFNASFHMMS